MKRMGFICTALILLMSATVTLSSCSVDDHDYEEEERIMDLLTKSRFGWGMRFEFRIVIDDEAIITFGDFITMLLDPLIDIHNPFYTDLIFVHNETEADALQLPNNIIVAWPRGGAEWTDGLIAGIHWAVSRAEDEIQQGWGQPLRPVVTLEEFGLSYPITIEDLIDNWEKVNALWNAFTSNERSFIQSAAPRGGPAIPESEADLAPVGGGDE